MLARDTLTASYVILFTSYSGQVQHTSMLARDTLTTSYVILSPSYSGQVQHTSIQHSDF